MRWVLLLAVALHADILIGDKPCLWKRAITVTGIVNYTARDTVWVDEYNQVCFKKTKQCNTKAVRVMPSAARRTDTTGWETYWDSCPAKVTRRDTTWVKANMVWDTVYMDRPTCLKHEKNCIRTGPVGSDNWRRE